MKFLPIVRPRHPTAVQLLPQLHGLFNSGHVTNNGVYVQQFEHALTDLLGTPTIVFSSGMAALVAMLRAVGVEGGGVICPSFTFAATPHAIVMAGATPVFAEIDAQTLTMDNADLERRGAGRDIRAVLGVDPYGICWEPPRSDVPVLIDAAPSFGSEINDGNAAQRGDALIFSFHATKVFSTMEGGALCSHEPHLISRAKKIRNFGQGPDGDCRTVGFNGKMLEICAAVGLKQLEDWQHRVPRRVESAIRLRHALAGLDLPGLRVQRAPLGQSPIWLYQPVFIGPEFGCDRDAVARGLEQHGIQTRPYYRACHLLGCYAETYPHLPVTEALASQVISLPVYDDMTEDEIGQIAGAFKEIHRS